MRLELCYLGIIYGANVKIHRYYFCWTSRLNVILKNNNLDILRRLKAQICIKQN